MLSINLLFVKSRKTGLNVFYLLLSQEDGCQQDDGAPPGSISGSGGIVWPVSTSIYITYKDIPSMWSVFLKQACTCEMNGVDLKNSLGLKFKLRLPTRLRTLRVHQLKIRFQKNSNWQIWLAAALYNTVKGKHLCPKTYCNRWADEVGYLYFPLVER